VPTTGLYRRGKNIGNYGRLQLAPALLYCLRDQTRTVLVARSICFLCVKKIQSIYTTEYRFGHRQKSLVEIQIDSEPFSNLADCNLDDRQPIKKAHKIPKTKNPIPEKKTVLPTSWL